MHSSHSTSTTGHQLFGWDFICSDVDVDAVAHARSTVERNSKALAGHIRIVSVTANSSLQEAVMGRYLSAGVGRCPDETTDRSLSVEGGSVRHDGDRPAVEGDGPVLQALRPLLLGQQDDGSHEELLQAVMCNPPFYDLTEEVGTYSTSVCFTGGLRCLTFPCLYPSPSLSLAVDPPQRAHHLHRCGA